MVDTTQIEACLIELNFLGAGDSIGPNESLFERGVIDSLGIGSLVGMLASQFGVVVPDEDLLPDHFDSISSIARYVNGKLGSDIAVGSSE